MNAFGKLICLLLEFGLFFALAIKYVLNGVERILINKGFVNTFNVLFRLIAIRRDVEIACIETVPQYANSAGIAR